MNKAMIISEKGNRFMILEVLVFKKSNLAYLFTSSMPKIKDF